MGACATVFVRDSLHHLTRAQDSEAIVNSRVCFLKDFEISYADHYSTPFSSSTSEILLYLTDDTYSQVFLLEEIYTQILTIEVEYAELGVTETCIFSQAYAYLKCPVPANID